MKLRITTICLFAFFKIPTPFFCLFVVCLFVLFVCLHCFLCVNTITCVQLVYTSILYVTLLSAVSLCTEPEPLLLTIDLLWTVHRTVHFYVQYMPLLRNQITSVHRRHFTMYTPLYIAITFKWMDQIFFFLFITKAEYVYFEIIDDHTWIVTGSLSIYNVKFCTLSTDDVMKGHLCVY